MEKFEFCLISKLHFGLLRIRLLYFIDSIQILFQILFYLQWCSKCWCKENKDIWYVHLFTSCLFTFHGESVLPTHVEHFSISGGIRVITIKDEFDELIFWEHSNNSESVRPYFLINGAEK